MLYGGDKMIDFPEATHVHRKIPKDAFYKHLPLSSSLKDKFVSDVNGIYIEWSLTKDKLHLEKASDIGEILILVLELKKRDFDSKIIEAIAKQNPHELVFILGYQNQRQLALYHGKLYRSEWMDKRDVNLCAKGFSISDIWDSLIEQVALTEENTVSQGLSVDERLVRQDKIKKLTKLVNETETSAWKEQQPKKQFELYQRVQVYKKELEEIING